MINYSFVNRLEAIHGYMLYAVYINVVFVYLLNTLLNQLHYISNILLPINGEEHLDSGIDYPLDATENSINSRISCI